MYKRVLTIAAVVLLGCAPLAARPAHKAHEQFGSGARVDGVDLDGAAAAAGIKPGDLIVAIDGKPINGYPDINPIVDASGPRPLRVDIDRNGQHMRVKVTPRASSEQTAQGGAQHKVLGISHTEMVADPNPPRPQNLVNMMFSDNKETAPKEGEPPPPRNLMEMLFPPAPEPQPQPQAAAPSTPH